MQVRSPNSCAGYLSSVAGMVEATMIVQDQQAAAAAQDIKQANGHVQPSETMQREENGAGIADDAGAAGVADAASDADAAELQEQLRTAEEARWAAAMTRLGTAEPMQASYCMVQQRCKCTPACIGTGKHRCAVDPINLCMFNTQGPMLAPATFYKQAVII